MDKKNFIKLINLLIDKRLKAILPSMVENEVKKYMKSGIEPTAKDFNSGIKNLIPQSQRKNVVIRDDKQKSSLQTEERQWCKNSEINKILNETAKDFTPLEKDPSDVMSYKQLIESEYENINEDFTFNTNNMTNLLSKEIVTRQPHGEISLKQQMIHDGASPEIANIMIKDYSKLLKNVDKITQMNRDGKK